MIPGELLLQAGDIEANVGRATLVLTVANTGDRTIQVGSHYHFAETNGALEFDRAAARGHRLNIAAGTAVRFEPGQTRTVELVALAGDRIVYGFTAAVMGPLDLRRKAAVAKKAGAGKPAANKVAAKKPAVKKPAAKPRPPASKKRSAR